MEPDLTPVMLAGAICAIPFAISVYMAIYRVEQLDAFINIATCDHRTNLLQDTPLPRYHPRRLWRILFLIMAWIGGGYLSFGVAISLFAWMPDDWRVWGGDFTGTRISVLAAVLITGHALLLLPLWWGWLTSRSWQRRRLENYKSRTEQYQWLLQTIIERPENDLNFWMVYAEKLQCFYIIDGQATELEIESKISTLRRAASLRKPVTLSYKDTDTFIAPTPQALALIHHLLTERQGLKLYIWPFGEQRIDYEEKFHELLSASPTGEKPPHLISSKNGYHSQRVIEVVLWADATGELDKIDAFLRKEAKWMLA